MLFAALVLNQSTAGEQRLSAKVWVYLLTPGDRVTITMPGGGGYGPPSARAGDDERDLADKLSRARGMAASQN